MTYLDFSPHCRYLNCIYLCFAFILEYDSEDDEEEGVDVGGEIARGFPQAELSVEDPEAVSSLNVLSLSHSVVFSVDISCKKCCTV